MLGGNNRLWKYIRGNVWLGIYPLVKWPLVKGSIGRISMHFILRIMNRTRTI